MLTRLKNFVVDAEQGTRSVAEERIEIRDDGEHRRNAVMRSYRIF